MRARTSSLGTSRHVRIDVNRVAIRIRVRKKVDRCKIFFEHTRRGIFRAQRLPFVADKSRV